MNDEETGNEWEKEEWREAENGLKFLFKKNIEKNKLKIIPEMFP